MDETDSSIPRGYCQCGCGRETTIATYTSKKNGIVKGQPNFYVTGHYRRQSSRVTKSCESCQVTFEVQRKKAETKRFCSRACWQEARAEQFILLECESCGSNFARRLSYQQYLTRQDVTRVFCSRACKNEGERITVPGQVIQDYKGGLTLKEVGGKHNVSAELVRRFLLKSGVQIRSRAAHLLTDKNPTKGKGHTKAAKAKIRAANLRQFSNPENRA